MLHSKHTASIQVPHPGTLSVVKAASEHGWLTGNWLHTVRAKIPALKPSRKLSRKVRFHSQVMAMHVSSTSLASAPFAAVMCGLCCLF